MCFDKSLKNNTSTSNPSVSKIHFNLAEICFHNIFFFTILICLLSLHPCSGLLYHLKTELYNHVNCSTSRHKTTAVVGGPWVGWSLMASLWHTKKQGTLGRMGKHGRVGRMDHRWEASQGRKCALTSWGEEHKLADSHCCFQFIFQW